MFVEDVKCPPSLLAVFICSFPFCFVDSIRSRFTNELLADNTVFAHGAYHRAMAPNTFLTVADRKVNKLTKAITARANFGQTSDRVDENGYKIRLHDWIDEIPNNTTVYVGHQVMDRVMTVYGELGGAAVFVDTGAGKGGFVSAINVDL